MSHHFILNGIFLGDKVIEAGMFGHAACIGKMRNANRSLVLESEGKRHLKYIGENAKKLL